MKPPPHRKPDPLLDAILCNEDLDQLRNDSLAQMLSISRQSRRRRKLTSKLAICLATTPLLILLSGLFWPIVPTVRKLKSHLHQPFIPSKIQEASHSSKPAGGVKLLNDEELLALFPGRPVALIGLPGQQQLIFLDEPGNSNPL